MRPHDARSTATRVFVVVLIAAALIGAVVAVLLVVEAQRTARAEAERVTAATAVALATSPLVTEVLTGDDRPTATGVLEPYTVEVSETAGLDFITVMTEDGLRVTHPDTSLIGEPYLGTIPTEPVMLTELFTGTLGPSVRTIAPVTGPDGVVTGWVAAGVTTETIAETFARRLPLTLGITAALVGVGSLGAWAARRATRRIAGDLPPGKVRDAVSSYESLRTLGDALRAQTHEHGNRLHTAVALLELDRREEAIEILTETARQSQSLVDQVTARRHGDPAVAALLLGKASQAKERGIDWRIDLAPEAPRSSLSAVDGVSVLGNLIDNAMDAAAQVEDRWVGVSLRLDDDRIVWEVADSGTGVPTSMRDHVFDQGFSTKPAGADGRGVGLALVRSIVVDAGGRVDILSDPTTFRVTLPVPGRRG